MEEKKMPWLQLLLMGLIFPIMVYLVEYQLGKSNAKASDATTPTIAVTVEAAAPRLQPTEAPRATATDIPLPTLTPLPPATATRAPTPVPLPSATPTCPGTPVSRLMVGMLARVPMTGGQPTNLRASATTNSAIVVQMPEGTTSTVIGGPVCGINSFGTPILWWQLQTAYGSIGWAVEGDFSEWALEPVW